MKITEITASASCKVSVGDYQSFDAYVCLKAALDEDDDVEESQRKLSKMCKDALRKEAEDIYKRRITPILPIIEGLGPNARAVLASALPAYSMIVALDDSLPTEATTPLAPVRNTNKVRVGGQRPKSPFDRPEKTEEKETSNAN